MPFNARLSPYELKLLLFALLYEQISKETRPEIEGSDLVAVLGKKILLRDGRTSLPKYYVPATERVLTGMMLSPTSNRFIVLPPSKDGYGTKPAEMDTIDDTFKQLEEDLPGTGLTYKRIIIAVAEKMAFWGGDRDHWVTVVFERSTQTATIIDSRSEWIAGWYDTKPMEESLRKNLGSTIEIKREYLNLQKDDICCGMWVGVIIKALAFNPNSSVSDVIAQIKNDNQNEHQMINKNIQFINALTDAQEFYNSNPLKPLTFWGQLKSFFWSVGYFMSPIGEKLYRLVSAQDNDSVQDNDSDMDDFLFLGNDYLGDLKEDEEDFIMIDDNDIHSAQKILTTLNEAGGAANGGQISSHSDQSVEQHEVDQSLLTMTLHDDEDALSPEMPLTMNL